MEQQGPFCASMCEISNKPFQDPLELHGAIAAYVDQDCANDMDCEIGQAYGYPMNDWDVSHVVDFSFLFSATMGPHPNPAMRFFNEDISGWDTSNVMFMFAMFRDAHAFNGDLSMWNTSNVVEMTFAFSMAYEFNSDLSNWDVSKAGAIMGMFTSNLKFNQDLSSWDTSSVGSMHGTFFLAEAFNGDVSTWNLSNVWEPRAMFYGAFEFNQDVSMWDMSAATDAGYMFSRAHSFNQDLCAWGAAFPYNEAHEIFRDSGCTYTDTPDEAQQGPFCASTCADR